MATILHIDKDEEAQQTILSAIGDQHNVVSASDGLMAIQYCAMIQPDLILMDLTLPDVDGYDLASRIKMFMPKTPILMLTDDRFEMNKVHALTLGPLKFLTKPIDKEQVQQEIQSLLPQPAQPLALDVTLTDNKLVQRFEAQITALNQANRRLASLNAISALIGTSLDLEHLTDEILAQIHRTIEFDSATLLLLKGDVLEAAASRGFSEYRRGMYKYSKSDRNSAWRVVSHKLPLIINDVKKSKYWEPRPELKKIRSWLGVPLIYKDRVVGVLTLDNNRPNVYTDADARYVFTLAYQIAIAVENAQLFEEWEKQAKRLKLINEVAPEINTFLDVDHLFDGLAKAIFERLHYDRVAILEVDEKRSFLNVKAIHGELPLQLEVGVHQHDINEGLIGRAISTGRPILVNDLPQDKSTLLVKNSKAQSVLIVPIFVGTQVEAVICVERDFADAFGDQDLWTLSSLGNQAATAIKNAWLYRGLDTYSERLERTIVARNQRLQAIKKLSQVVSQGLDINELLVVVGQGIGQIFSPEAGEDVQVKIGLVDGSNIALNVIYGTEADWVGIPPQSANLSPSYLYHRVLELKIDPLRYSGQVIIQAKPKILNSISTEEVYRLPPALSTRIIGSLIMSPLITGGKTIGLIMVECRQAEVFDDSDLETLETLAFQVASAIEHARLLKKTKEIAIVEERTRLARDMHDGVAQNLAYLLIQVDRCLNMIGENGSLEKQLEQISSLLKQNIEELRRNIFDLRPVDLKEKSIFGVVENFVSEFGYRWNLETKCEVSGRVTELAPEVESSLYRILQEALSNARKHANCTQLSVSLTTKNSQWITLEVEDDGQGFEMVQDDEDNPNSADKTGLGLISMRERVESVGGQLTVDSAKGHGTRIFAQLPVLQALPLAGES